MSLPSIQAARGWSGLAVVDSDDHPLGKIIHIYLDHDTGLPEWALVAMPGRRRQTFVPLAGAARKGNRVAVAVSKAAVSDAPTIRPGRELSDDDAARLYGHYVGASDDRKRGARRAPRRGLATRLKEVTAPPARDGQEPSTGGRAVRPRATVAAAGRAGLGAGGGHGVRRTRPKPSGAGRRRGTRRGAGRDPGHPARRPPPTADARRAGDRTSTETAQHPAHGRRSRGGDWSADTVTTTTTNAEVINGR
jgi:PRC-barrel domain